MATEHPYLLSAFADESSQNFDEQLDAVSRNGITHIELRGIDGKPIHEQDLESIRTIKQKASDAGIGFSAVGSSLGKCELHEDLEKQRAMCGHLVEIAHILETPYIRMFSYRLPQNSTPAECRQKVIDNLGVLVEVVDGTGVMLAHENEKHIYGETAECCLDLYRAFYGTGCFKGVFDFANFIQAGQNPLTDCWPLLRCYTEYFHIKDALLENGQVVPPGEGDGNLPTILGEVLSQGYSNYLTLEPHLWPKHYPDTTAAERFDIAAKRLKEILDEIEKQETA